MLVIYLHTITIALRQKYLQALSGLLLFLFVLVAYNGVIAHKTRLQGFERAKATVRKAWLNQGQQNPHSSAHYGHYIFQPVTAMHFLDNGIRPFAGSVLRLEAHAQNEATFSPVQNKTELSRLGDMGFSWMLQVLMPLFIILISFNAVSADRENQNLKLLSAQGIPNNQYLWGKIFSFFSIAGGLAAIGLGIQLAAYYLCVQDESPVSVAFVCMWAVVYGVYLFLVSGISVLVSAWLKESRSALLVQLAAWVALCLVVPKLTASMGTTLYPLEHKEKFTKALRADREKGIDGHNPADERAKKFMDSVIAHYKIDAAKVKDVSAALPINVDGLVMQADEEYANMVYDKHFSRIRSTIAKQNSISKYASFLNPYLAIRNASMGICQSDFSSHLNLLAAAETYRRYLIKELNDKMAYGGSKTGDWDWKVDASYWETIKDFSYPQDSLMQSLLSCKTELIALGIWLILLVLGVIITSKNLTVL